MLMMGKKGEGYGRLYNWYAVSDAKFAPSGWHVPTKAEIDTLIDYMIANEYNYDDTTEENRIAKALATDNGWAASAVTGAVGNTDYPAKRNVSGFSGMPAGIRTSVYFIYVKNYGWFWTATETGRNGAVGYHLDFVDIDLANDYYDYKTEGLSVRLIKDDSTDPSTMTDYDNNTYDTVKIGTQVFTKQNWKCTKLNDGTSIPNVTVQATWAALKTLGRCAYDNDENNV